MRLLVDCSYYKILFSKECNISAVIDAVSTASVVEESGPYNHRILEIKPDTEIGIKLIPDDDIKLPNSDKPSAITELLKIAKERDELSSKVYRLEAEIKKITDVIVPKEKS
jgi:hypothetical protein